MIATIITIGDEILIGQIVDSNSAFMAKELNQLGVKVNEILSVSDTSKAITESLDKAIHTSDIVLLTGGLGPTKDDITKQTLAKYFKCGMKRHQPTLDKIEKRLSQLGVMMSEINRAQADVPEVCTILTNNSGSAPGMLFELEGKAIISMPGVPYEMKDIMLNEVIPYIKRTFTLPFRLHKTFQTASVAESTLSDRLEPFEHMLPEYFSLAYLPTPGRVRLRLSANGKNQEQLQKEFKTFTNRLLDKLGDDLFGYDTDTLEEIVGKMLSEKGYTIATAESCTGGNIAKTITSVPGASKYFLGSIVAYANNIKHKFLNVQLETIEDKGAVSKDVVIQMAEGVKEGFNADFGVATSGVAGPSGGTKDKPVGTVWIALASPNQTMAAKFNFGKHRERTVIRSTVEALNMIRKEINNIEKKTVNKV
jgi:nicotinamide-nucleotide amidase